MKKIIILALLAIVIAGIVPSVKAGWGRLVLIDEKVDVNGWSAKTVKVVYDRLEKVNCYVLDGESYNSGNAIFCMKAEK